MGKEIGYAWSCFKAINKLFCGTEYLTAWLFLYNVDLSVNVVDLI